MLPSFHFWSTYSVNSGRSCTEPLRAEQSFSFDSRDRSEFPRDDLRSTVNFRLTGLCVDSSRFESCDEDVVDGGAALELEDPLEKPGTTVGT